ncbi:MAG TPA: nuclear transport factor 2 family protein [Solirubrobacterales bacterium]|nr:nuclear transport factor 2 family protein [Solirubrobacterales bacterium]
MSQENVELVREAWGAFLTGGIDAALDYYAEDSVCEDWPELPDRSTYEGREGLRERNQQFAEGPWRDFDFEPTDFIDAGEGVVVAVVALRGHGRGSGVPVDTVAAFVYEVRVGRIARDRAFTSRSQALEAAGLREQAPSQESLGSATPDRGVP